MLSNIQIAAGSIPGRDHLGRGEVLLGRNNQDAFFVERTEQVIAAVVTDGCGSAPHSEVGARLGARLLAKTLVQSYRRAPGVELSDALVSEAFVERLRTEILRKLRLFALQLACDAAEFANVIRDYLLFTSVAVLVTPRHTLVFSLGDGVVAINGAVTALGPFPENRPPYLAYGLVSSSFAQTPELLRFQIHTVLPTSELNSLLIGTDGAADLVNLEGRKVPGKDEFLGSLGEFWENESYFRNPDGLRRRLSVLNREVRRFNPDTGVPESESGLLRDDTTLAVLRTATPTERG